LHIDNLNLVKKLGLVVGMFDALNPNFDVVVGIVCVKYVSLVFVLAE
jgi:hypothetical protein